MRRTAEESIDQSESEGVSHSPKPNPRRTTSQMLPGEPGELLGTREDVAYRQMNLGRDDILYVRNGSGGGIGDPLLRDPSCVARDVASGLVSDRSARDVYGVVLSDKNQQVDVAATLDLRAAVVRARAGAYDREVRTSANDCDCRAGAVGAPRELLYSEQRPSRVWGPVFSPLDEAGYLVREGYCPECFTCHEAQVVPL